MNDCPVYECSFKCVVVVECFSEYDGGIIEALENVWEFDEPFIVPMPFSAPE